MNINIYEEIFEDILKNVTVQDEKLPNGYIRISGLTAARRYLDPIFKTDLFKKERAALEVAGIYRDTHPTIDVDPNSFATYKEIITRIKTNVTKFLELIKLNKLDEHPESLEIMLPPVITFSDLSKQANDFKLSIEQSLIDLGGEHSEMEITAVKNGSIWLTVVLATETAMRYIGRICNMAINVRKKVQEVKENEVHIKSLNLKTEMMEEIAKQQKKLLNAYVEEVTKEITDEFIPDADAQKIQRLQNAVETMASLYERGALVLANDNTPQRQSLFPSSVDVMLLQSNQKQIEGEKEQGGEATARK